MYSLKTISEIARDLTPLIVLGSAIAAFLAIRVNEKINKRNKRADTIIHCNNRYDDLYKFRMDVVESSELVQVKAYYARYWGLKSDEFDYWLARLIDIETYTNWTFLLIKSFAEETEKTPIGNGSAVMSFARGWNEVGQMDNLTINPWFLHLITQLRLIAEKEDNRLDRLLASLEDVERTARKYRNRLQGEMSLKFYRDNRRVRDIEWNAYNKKFPTLRGCTKCQKETKQNLSTKRDESDKISIEYSCRECGRVEKVSVQDDQEI